MFILIILVVFSSVSCIKSVRSDPSEPEITVVPLQSLDPNTDRWDVIVSCPDGSDDLLHFEGKRSDPSLSNVQSEILVTTVYNTADSQFVQQDVLLGFSYSWDYTLEILGKKFGIFEFNLDIGFPVRIDLRYSEPMVEGVSHPLYATLTPLDWPSFDEFTCDFEVIGHAIFDVAQSFVTPIGPENAWTPLQIGPYWVWVGIPIVVGTLDVGLAIVPELFSERVEALVKVSGDASLQNSAITLNGEFVDLLTWNSPGQTLQFDVQAEDISSLDCASILISQFRYFLNKLLIGFNAVLQAHTPFGSPRGEFRLFTLDASGLLPTLSFGTHPQSPASEIQVNVPVVALNVVPEIPWGTVVASAVMIIALVAYVAAPKWRRKATYINP